MLRRVKKRESAVFPGLRYELVYGEGVAQLSFLVGRLLEHYTLIGGQAIRENLSTRRPFRRAMSNHCEAFARELAQRLANRPAA